MAAILLVSFCKGAITDVQDWGKPNWVVSYGHGLIKRGLVGQVFTWTTHGQPTDQKWAEVLLIHYASCLALLAGLILWVKKAQPDRALLAICCLFAASQFPPTLAYNTGYLDVYLYLATGAAGFCIARGLFWPAIALGLAGSFIHESLLFPWLTLICLMLRDQRSIIASRRVLPWLAMFAPVISGIAVYLLHSQSAARAELAAAPVPDDIKAGMFQTQFGQTIGSSIATMAEKTAAHWGNLAISLGFFALPSALMLSAYIRSRRMTARDQLVLWVAAFAPLSVLAVAWDLSRFVVMTCLAALLAVLYAETAWRPERRSLPNAWLCALGVLVVLYMASPFVYAYYENAAVFHGWWPMKPLVHWLFTAAYTH